MTQGSQVKQDTQMIKRRNAKDHEQANAEEEEEEEDEGESSIRISQKGKQKQTKGYQLKRQTKKNKSTLLAEFPLLQNTHRGKGRRREKG